MADKIRHHSRLFSKNNIALIISALSLQACYSPQVLLTPREEELSAALAEEFRCKVEMWHDKEAVLENKKDGVFDIRMTNRYYDLCSEDSLYLKKIGSRIAEKIIEGLSHRESYMAIEVSFQKERTGKSGYEILCSKTVKVDIDDVNNPELVDRWMPEKRKYTPSDKIIER